MKGIVSWGGTGSGKTVLSFSKGPRGCGKAVLSFSKGPRGSGEAFARGSEHSSQYCYMSSGVASGEASSCF